MCASKCAKFNSDQMCIYDFWLQAHPFCLKTALLIKRKKTPNKTATKKSFVDSASTKCSRVKINTSSACVFLVGDRNDQNIPHGKGKMMFHENEEGKMVYEGQWFKGRIQGFGTMTWKRGDV